MATANTRPQRTIFGHPVGLYVLFFTEMWERFSYYGMRALLILYMVNYFRWDQKDASSIYKVYTSFVYVTPIIGGFLADRYLGNRWAVIIGAVLMSIGHFLMAFEEYPIFMSALIFLILGNGFFKPNMSTQVGRLYPANDGRRDGAYTIFYMGINLGAFLSPIVCGWLADNTVGGFHSGFTMAGIGMVAGLLIYLLGQPLIQEIPADTTVSTAVAEKEKKHEALTEAEAAVTPSVLGSFSNVLPLLLLLGGIFMACAAAVLFFLGQLDLWNTIMLAIGGGCSLLMAYISSLVKNGVRDRVTAILLLGLFVMFFWAAFEQAGNVLNVWADQSTDRFLTRPAAPVSAIPTVAEDNPAGDQEVAVHDATGFLNRFVQMFANMVTLKARTDGSQEKSWSETIADAFNPVPTAWFQAINALAIFLLAPLFAWMWVKLEKGHLQPSIPMKMVLGLLLMSASMAIMLGAANQEHRQTVIGWGQEKLPQGIVLLGDNCLGHKNTEGPAEAFHAGRLTYDPQKRQLVLFGVLTENERDLMIEKTAPANYTKKIDDLQKMSKELEASSRQPVAIDLEDLPPGFDMKFAGLPKSVVEYLPPKPGQKLPRLVAYKELAEKEVKGLLVAGGHPVFRGTIQELWAQSTTFRVASWWLFWSYILATLGELCLSPVGLSMVSKLAPAKFATMLMGMWMLTSAFGNFAAGALGEIWGTIPPISFFILSTAVVGGAALVLWVAVRFVTATMHGVK